jgi:hypothetical protein
MTATLPVPTRYLALIGVALLLAMLALVVRPLVLGGDSDATPVTPVVPAGGAPAPAAPAQPKVELLPGLPKPIAAKLLRDQVVVVQIYSGTSSTDRAMVAVARKGARTAGATFTALNVLDEARARDVSSFIGTVDTPAVAVVRRPGKVVTLIEGPVDAAIVEQAAHNAGAR